jgi:hypothetical protein
MKHVSNPAAKIILNIVAFITPSFIGFFGGLVPLSHHRPRSTAPFFMQ